MSHTVDKFECRICKTSDEYPRYTLYERMYDSREPFDYIHCTSCGCLQIFQIPHDLEKYYPSNYYSQLERIEPKYPSGIKGILQQWYCRSAVLKPHQLLGKKIRSYLPCPTDFAEYGHYLIEANLVSHTDKILDVGCGASPHRLTAFHRCGFSGVEGIDPYISVDTKYHNVPVYKRTIDQMQGQYGLIMFHHSLEHVRDPVETLQTASNLLYKGGTCLIRIPVMSTYFWRTFGTNWVELDAPRHLYLMEEKTIEFLAKKTGLKLRKTVFDSLGWEIATSLKYQFDISNGVIKSNNINNQHLEFSEKQLQEFSNQAIKLNQANEAGRACFYLEKVN